MFHLSVMLYHSEREHQLDAGLPPEAPLSTRMNEREAGQVLKAMFLKMHVAIMLWRATMDVIRTARIVGRPVPFVISAVP